MRQISCCLSDAQLSDIFFSLSENHPIMCAKLCVCVFGLFSPDYFELPLKMRSCQIKLNKSCQNRKKGEENELKLEKTKKQNRIVINGDSLMETIKMEQICACCSQ